MCSSTHRYGVFETRPTRIHDLFLNVLGNHNTATLTNFDQPVLADKRVRV